MDKPAISYPQRRTATFKEWAPSVHYAQFQQLPPGALPERRLYDFELLYVCQGAAATTMLGQRHILEAGQLILLPSGVLHQNEALAAPFTRFLGIHFDYFGELDIQTDADMVVNESAVQSTKFAVEACAESMTPLSVSPIYTPPLPCIQLMEQLVDEFTMRLTGYELVCRALLLNILAYLLRSPASALTSSHSEHSSKIAEIISLIEASPGASWTNKNISEKLHMSIDHTAKLFRQIAGKPPGEFVQTIRHREARRLLRETELSIEQVGEAAGYPDIHYFSRIFRRLEGIPPREYRKLSRIL
ncbi:helix-turn-helix domain-containing protein [Paenibacillus sp. BAC0078]